MVTEEDHTDLVQAIALIQGVLDRHRSDDTSAMAFSCLCGAQQAMRIAERYMGGDGE